MIQTTMYALLTSSLIPPGDEYVYIIRSGEDVMYVGKTKDPLRRMGEHQTGIFLTFAMDNRKDVLRWTVELREVEECREYLLPGYRYLDRDVAEICTIQTLCPVLNTTHNFHPSPMPAQYKRLFELIGGETDDLF